MARASSGGRVTSKASVRKTSLTRGRGSAAKRLETAQANGSGEPLIVYFDDIRLVRDLLGDYDANLAVLEDRLGVEAVVNGNAVALRGPDEACAAAKSVLEQLYGRLRKAKRSASARWSAPSAMPASSSRRTASEPGGTVPPSIADPDAKAPHHRAHAGAKHLSRFASAQRSRLRHRPRRHRQDLSRRRLRRGLSRGRALRPADPVAACGRGRRAARLPPRRHAREGRPLFAPAL